MWSFTGLLSSPSGSRSCCWAPPSTSATTQGLEHVPVLLYLLNASWIASTSLQRYGHHLCSPRRRAGWPNGFSALPNLPQIRCAGRTQIFANANGINGTPLPKVLGRLLWALQIKTGILILANQASVAGSCHISSHLLASSSSSYDGFLSFHSSHVPSAFLKNKLNFGIVLDLHKSCPENRAFSPIPHPISPMVNLFQDHGAAVRLRNQH